MRSFLTFIAIAIAAKASPVGLNHKWLRSQRLEDDLRGQNHYTFADAMASRSGFLVVGSVSSNMNRGHARVYFHNGTSYIENARIADPNGFTGDGFGCSVALNHNATELVIGAKGKGGRGAAFVYRRQGEWMNAKWGLVQALIPSESLRSNSIWWHGVHEYGRTVTITDDLITVSLLIKRPGQHARNIKGTPFFYETLKDEDLTFIQNDYIVLFQRRKAIYVNGLLPSDQAWGQVQIVRSTYNNPRSAFGTTVSLSRHFLVVGATSRIRIANASQGGGLGHHDVGGMVHVFILRNLTGTKVAEVQRIRPPKAYYIGHSIALSEDSQWLFLGSEWYDRDPSNQTQWAILQTNMMHDQPHPDSVFVYRRNQTDNFAYFGVIEPPSNASRFGYSIALWNETLVVSAPGDGSPRNSSHGLRGSLYVYTFDTSRQTWAPYQIIRDDSQFPTTRLSNVSDNFGALVAFDYPHIISSTGSADPLRLVENQYLSVGAAIVYRWIARQIAAAASAVVCEYSTLTLNVTLRCIVHARDAGGQSVGQREDALYFTPQFSSVGAVPAAPLVVFFTTGEFYFDVKLYRTAASTSISATYNGVPLGHSFSVTTTPEVWPQNTTVKCNTTVPAGFVTVCTITAFNGAAGGSGLGGPAGLADAARLFQVGIHNIDRQSMAGEDAIVASRVKFVRPGVFSFTFIPNEEGVHAVLVRYDHRVIRHPNPWFVEVTVPLVSVSTSYVSCPTVVFLNANVSCVITLRGTQFGALAGTDQTTKKLNVSLWNSGSSLDVRHVSRFSQGKWRFTFTPATVGNVKVIVTHSGEPIRNDFWGFLSSVSKVTVCNRLPSAQKTIPVFVGHFLERNNNTVFLNEFSSTNVVQNGFTVCEDVRRVG